jgi:taurine dehydrogenase large subunit
VAGKGGALDLPIFTSALPGHGLLTPFRRLGQWGIYRWYHLQDEVF